MEAETIMHTTRDQMSQRETCYHGLRMTAEEYFQLGETFQRYELIDGVICMSPSASALHQRIITRVSAEIVAHLKLNPVGEVYVESDVSFGPGPSRGDIVYRPDITFLSSPKAASVKDRIAVAPDVVVEVVSPSSRRYDTETKKSDYERFQVAEYWIIDPHADELIFYYLDAGKYVAQTPSDHKFASRTIEGFILDLQAVRALFK